MNRENLERVKKYILDNNEGVNVIIQNDKMWLVLLSSGKAFQLSDAEIMYQYRQSTVLTVKASRFLEWFYSDDIDLISLGNDIVNMFKSQGHVNLIVRELYDSCGYIPSHIVNGYVGDFETEFDPSDVEFIDDVTK